MSEDPQQIDWPSIVVELSERLDADCIEPSVREVITGAGSQRLLIACSGGADSVFLLCLLYARRAELNLDLHVAHYNHRWRDDASRQDAEFVRGLASALDLPYYLDERPENEAAFTETTARRLRLEFLRKAALEAGCAFIAFGHQLDDVLETQLQRLARGVGTDGLAAPRPVATFRGQPTHLRPLLNLRAGDIRMTLNAAGIPWREDSSNEDTSIARNLLRHEVIPTLTEALDRDPGAGAARSRQLLEEDASALNLLARERLPDAFAGEDSLSRSDLSSLPRALMRRALTAWLDAHGLIDSVSAAALDQLIGELEADRVSFRQSAGARFICLSSEQVWVEDKVHEAPLEHVQFGPGETVVLSSGYVIESEELLLDDKVRERIMRGGVDVSTQAVLVMPDELPMDVRSWQAGDRFHPLGAPGSKKLKDWFIDRQIPKKERKLLPVVISASGEVIWVPGFPPAESCKIDRHTKQALRLTYRPRNSR